MTQGERLAYVIRCTGMTQKEFAGKVGLIPPTINKLTSGVLKMTEQYIVRICDAFPDINPDYLRGESNDAGIAAPLDIVRIYKDRIKEKDDVINRLLDEMEMQRRVIARLLDAVEKKGD